MRYTTRINATFWGFWLLALLWCRFNSFDDPSSIFYNREAAYAERYSAVRAAQVDQFYRRQKDANLTLVPVPAATDLEGDGQLLCIGIPSINRTSEAFLARTVGSLVDSLNPSERLSVHITVLLADKSPTEHFAYHQDWLTNVVDEVLIYEQEGTSHEVRRGYHTIPFTVRDDGQPRGDGRIENIRLDHSVLVETCRDRGAKYFAFIEDDVIASPDWYRKFVAAVAKVESRSQRSGKDWIYLRLFYSELFMGWNAEEWMSYARTILLVYVLALTIFFVLRRRRRRRYDRVGGPTKGATPQTFNHVSAMALGLWLPATIALFFLAGRITLHRLGPFPLSGVREMPHYGCCAQGLVFPSRHLPGFQKLLRDPPFDFAGDQMLEGFADDRGLRKWALDPSVMQHVGLKQSSDGPRIAEVWNFSFERRTDLAPILA